MANALKPFYINLNDLSFLLSQVNFVPLFDGPANSNGIVAFDPLTATADVYSAHGVKLWDHLTGQLTAAATNLGFATVADLGTGFPQVSSSIGIRDVSGLHNNLFGDQAFWGAVDIPFRRDVGADFTNFVTTGGVDYTPGTSILDLMPRIISRTITTGGVNLLEDLNGHYVNWDPVRYANDAGYATLINDSGVNISQLVEGAKIVAPVNTAVAVLDGNGDALVWHLAQYQASVAYAVTLAIFGASSYGGLMDSTGGALQDGEVIYYRPAPNAALVSIGQTYQPDLLAYKQLVDGAGVNFATIAEGAEITTTLVSSGYGLLEEIGHIDFQNPDSGEYFIGSENPGVAPVNSWFGIFGQFFDHGLDLIGKGGNGKVIVQLETTDPLYRAPGTNGADDPGNTAIVISRATIAGTDGNGDPNYVNHTSPFIDQSQTYGSVDQITMLLRKWVPDGDGSGYHAGIELFDGQSLVETWDRRWPDGTVTPVHDTLPTLSELRDHVLDTGRSELTWEDVANYRNRNADGSLATGSSNHALILDMNTRFDAAHLTSNSDIHGTTVAARVSAAVGVMGATVGVSIENMANYATLNVGRSTTGDTFTQNLDGTLKLHLQSNLVVYTGPGNPPMTLTAGDYSGATALLPFVNMANFDIMSPPPSLDPGQGTALNAAVGEILMASIGDHYIAGDGRVNENFGLTSIHHVFHEEHNYQVENLKSWIYAHDANNSPLDHSLLHDWQINNNLATNNTDADGNYLNADGSVSWNPDKMFNATKLIVEMEYQHAAVDQYARTITPRIQEFVGYSTGVDSTISLEYSQVAFRFGHSTIRETIDTVDPSGWMLGHVTRYALESAFLNPSQFAESGVAAITLGLSRQQMNEVDEFVTPALNQGLLGQPLDLPAINIARSRDLGIPTLNDFREAISLARYTSWDDFGKNMFHPESLVNFIAAYSFGGGESGVAMAEAMIGLFDGSILEGDAAALGYTAADAVAFMLNNATTDSVLNTARDGFNHIDSWIGGLAEAHVPGGLLGETFDAVFVAQIQSLMDGDRFYYLYRLFGTNLHEEVNNGQFKDIVERNTGLSHLNGSIFAYADKYYDFNRDALPASAVLHNLANTANYYTDENGQLYQTRTGLGTLSDPFVFSGKINAGNPLPVGDQALFNGAIQVSGEAGHGYGVNISANPNLGIFSDGGNSTDPNGDIISVTGSDFIRLPTTLNYIRDVRVDALPDLVHPLEGTPTDGADSHEVIVATDNVDYIHARGGDDTVYGEGGDDYIFGDGGIDRLYGGDGNDMLDSGEGPDLVDGGAGKDIIYGRGSGSEVGGFDQLVGGTGNDLVIGGEGIDKLSGGSGDDIIYGDGLTNPEMGNTDAFTHGGDGNDYIDTGASGDLLFGEEGDDYLVGGIDQDLMQGGAGDDIVRPGSPSQASGTTGGPDEVVGDDGLDNAGFDLIDLSDYVGNAPGQLIDFSTQNNPLVAIDATSPFPAWFQIEGAIGTRNSDTFIGDSAGDATTTATLAGSNWLIGGSGSDTFSGLGGNDLIVGGSIRLDQLIGQYAGADNGNLALGSVEWLADAMATGTGGTGYGDNSENEYTGASNRATGPIGAGLLDNALLGTEMFDKHFTDMLQSRMFKDVVLGDGGTDVASTDSVKFIGNMAEYSIEVINFGSVQALKVTDHGGLIDDGNGVLVARAEDGIDLIVGVEQAVFADQTISLIPTPPVLDLTGDQQVTTTTNFSENFSTTSYTDTDAGGPGPADDWTQDWIETNDDNSSTSDNGQIRINGNALEFDNGNSVANSDGAIITRTVDLNGATSASLSFTYSEQGFDNADNESVQVQFAADGSNFTTLATIDGSSGNGSFTGPNSIALTGALSSSSAIRFVVSAVNGNNDLVSIDNIVVAKNVTSTVPGAAGNDYSTSYTEGGNRIAISSFTGIADDSATMASARVVLHAPVSGDLLRIGNSTNSNGTVPNTGNQVDYQVTTLGNGDMVLDLSGIATRAQYQAALDLVRYYNNSDDPTAHGTSTARHIEVTVNDGLWTSNVATTTINVTAVNDSPTAGDDFIVTNQSTVTVAESLLLANDTDIDGPSALDVTLASVSGGSLTSVSLSTTPGSLTIVDNGTPGGTAQYTVSDGGTLSATDTATVNVTRVTGTTLTGAAGGNSNRSEILIGGAANDSVNGGGGSDTALGGDGDDTITYAVTTGGGGTISSGRDIIDGGSNTATGDRFVLNGTGSTEVFRIYSNTDDWDNNVGNGIQSSAAHAGITGLNANTAIVITRNGNLNSQTGVLTGAAVLAELRNIEEITINTLDVSINDGNGVPNDGSANGDTVQILGDFTSTGLSYSTITVNGGNGNDTVDISGLTSAHRIVFNTGSGSDHVIGELRPQDVVTTQEVGSSVVDGVQNGDPTPVTLSAVVGTDGNDVLRGTNDANVISAGAGNDLVFGGAEQVDITSGDGNDIVFGGDGGDRLFGGSGNDQVFGEDGNDRIWGEDGNDMLEGGDGDDLIFAGHGNDVVEGGRGTDRVYGGAGNDTFVASSDDGAGDHYYGEDGNDTLDLSLITARLTVDLRPAGALGFGSVTTADGVDTISGIENVVLGSHADSVTASNDVNHLSGGAGDDTFGFRSVAGANGDRIADFETGDVIDLRFIDAVDGGGDNSFSMSVAQSFNSAGQPVFTASGQLLVHFDAANQETVLLGNTNGSLDVAEFRIVLEGGNHVDDILRSGAVLS